MVARVLASELGEHNMETASALANLSNVLFEQGRFDESMQTLQRSLDANAAAAGTDTSDYALSLFAMARTQRAAGDLDAAEASAARANATLTGIFGDSHSQTLRARHLLAAIALDRLPQPGPALDEISGLLDHVEAHLELESRRGRRLRIELLTDRARAQRAQGEHSRAQALLQEALAIGNSEFPDGHRVIVTAALELADLQLAAAETGAARRSLQRAESSNPHRQPLTAHSRALRARLLEQLGGAG
jgi:tetratricopeptide (TPR) repeat protein